MSRTPLAPEDAARLHMDVPENRMIIVAALELDGRLGTEPLLELLRDRLLLHSRFRQRVIESAFGLGVPYWQDDARFDLARHVVRHGPSDRPLLERIAEVANRELSRDKPLWEMHLFEGSETDVLVARVHHVLADGAHLVRILEELADDHARAPEQGPKPKNTLRRRRGMRVQRLIGGVAGAVRLFRAGADPRSSLSGKLGSVKRLCASPTLSLEALHGHARESGFTITELLLSSISGALRGRVHGVVHALVPVALRGSDDDAGNRYVSIFVPLRVTIDDPRERARVVASELRALRERHSSISSGVRLTSAAGAATALVERAGVRLFSKRATLMVSVVRGPERTIRLAGAAVRDVIVWAPVPGTIAVGVTMMSYAGRVRLGLNADAVVRDPEGLLSAILRELETQTH